MRNRSYPPSKEWGKKKLSWDVALFLEWYRMEQVFRRRTGLELMTHFEVKKEKTR